MTRYLLLLSALTVAAFQIATLAAQVALFERMDEMGARLGQIQSSGETVRMEGESARPGGDALTEGGSGAEQGRSGADAGNRADAAVHAGAGGSRAEERGPGGSRAEDRGAGGSRAEDSGIGRRERRNDTHRAGAGQKAGIGEIAGTGENERNAGTGENNSLTPQAAEADKKSVIGLKRESETRPETPVAAGGGFTRGAGLRELPLMEVRDGGELSRDDFAAAPLISAEHLYGASDARFRLHLFTDFSCPFCQRLFRPMLKLIEENPRELSLEFRHFPLEQHGPQTLLRAVLAECAAVTGGNRSFWQAADGLFVSADYTRLARSISVSEHRVSACAQDPAMVQRIREDVLEGKALGIGSTPAVVVLDRLTNTRLILTGLSGTDQIRQAIGRMLVESERRQEGMHYETLEHEILQSEKRVPETKNENGSGQKNASE